MKKYLTMKIYSLKKKVELVKIRINILLFPFPRVQSSLSSKYMLL